jgi:hypothetical protein
MSITSSLHCSAIFRIAYQWKCAIIAKRKEIKKSMKTSEPRNNISNKQDHEEWGEEEYDDFTVLERLETLREDMEDLRINNLQELIARIEELHRQLDNK